jgi:hypothetical protein
MCMLKPDFRYGLRFALFIVVLGLLTSIAVAAAPDDGLIVLGKRIGPVFIGMNPAELLQALGAPDSAHGSGDSTQYRYQGKGLVIWARNGRVSEVYTSDPRYRAAAGIHVGSSELELVASIGQPKWKRANNRGESGSITYCYKDGTDMVLGGPNASDAGRVRTIWINGCKP